MTRASTETTFRQALLIGGVVAFTTVVAAGATGDVLLQYDSAAGTLPFGQGWTCQSGCLKTNCPSNPLPPDPGTTSECRYQGELANDCTLGHGCGPSITPAFTVEHYNAPPRAVGTTGACSYTEWIAFDDGEDFVGQAYPVPLPHRNLTFGPDITETRWGAHVHPAFGAPAFINAPVGHHAIRIATGSGVPFNPTAPILFADAGNNRNLGKINIRRTYTVPVGVTSLTLVAKLACGNRDLVKQLFQWSAFGCRFAVGADGRDGSATLGQFGRGSIESGALGLFGTRTVVVALARDHVPGPQAGEFFTIRLVLRNDKTLSAWLNDDAASLWTGTAYTGATDTSVQINPGEQGGTMWLDHIRVMAGELPPAGCGDPVFDVNDDWRVDPYDLSNGQNGFLDCVTGPLPPPGVFNGLSAKCKCHDTNHDAAVDMNDFAVFQRCLTSGNNVAASPTCDD